MALIPTVDASDADGAAVTYAAAAAGDQAEVGGTTLIVKTAGTGTTVTVAVPGNEWNGAASPDTEVTLAATEERHIPLDGRYRDPATGYAELSYTSLVDVTRAVVKH